MSQQPWRASVWLEFGDSRKAPSRSTRTVLNTPSCTFLWEDFGVLTERVDEKSAIDGFN